MKKYPPHSSPEKKALSCTIIPSTSHKIIQFMIPNWVLITGAGLIITMFFFSIGISSAFLKTRAHLAEAQSNLATLETENTTQSIEITQLRERSAEIEKKLVSLDQLQDKILAMVGLESKSLVEAGEGAGQSTPTFLVSRSNQRIDLSNNDNSLEEEMTQLNHLIDMQTENLEQLVTDVEKQLEYMETIPDLYPTEGRLTSPFGYRISPINRRREFHSGIDLANKTGTPVYASASGIVIFSGYNGSYGRMVMISHGQGYTTVYAHNSSNLVKVGDRVSKGEQIATIGSTGRSTGPHLHFEIRENGNAIDPLTLLKK